MFIEKLIDQLVSECDNVEKIDDDDNIIICKEYSCVVYVVLLSVIATIFIVIVSYVIYFNWSILNMPRIKYMSKKQTL